MKKISKSEKETLAIASDVAKKIKTGEVLTLSGDLGAGKTIFAKGFIGALGFKGVVVSPTFVLMKIYKITKHPKIKQVCHIDAYRLKNPAELEMIGALDYFGRDDTVTLIEWPERAKKLLPKKIKKIKIKHKNEQEREIEIK